MSDWTYVVGETSYNQDFLPLNQETNEPLVLSGTITMFITDSAFANPIPANGLGQTLDIVTNENGIEVARLPVNAAKMPTTPGIFMVQLKIDSAQVFKSFFLNLRAVRSITT